MLVLQRNYGERIIMQSDTGEVITIMVTETSQRWCKLGIEAPLRWRIMREEIIDQRPHPPEVC